MRKTGLIIIASVLLVIMTGWLFMRNMGMNGNITDRGMMGSMPGGGMNRSAENANNQSLSADEKPLPIPPLLKSGQLLPLIRKGFSCITAIFSNTRMQE